MAHKALKDERFRVKNEINLKSQSSICEQKLYSSY